MLSLPGVSSEVKSQSKVSWLLDLVHSSVLSEELSHGYGKYLQLCVFTHFLLCLRQDEYWLCMHCIPRRCFSELVVRRCRRFHVQARELCVSRDLQSRLRCCSVQQLCGPGTPKYAIPQSLQGSANWTTLYFSCGFFVWVFFLWVCFPPICSELPHVLTNHLSTTPSTILDFFFLALPNLIFHIAESCLDGFWRYW